MIKKVFLSGVVLAAVVLSACTDRNDFFNETANSENSHLRSESVDPDKEFADVPFFYSEEEVQDAVENEGTSVPSRSLSNSRIRTIAEERASIESRMVLTETPDHYQMTGISEQEIEFLSKADSLIVDPAMEKIVSKDFLIRVADRVYKIDYKGIFSFNAVSVTRNSIDEYVRQFQTDLAIADGDDVIYQPMPTPININDYINPPTPPQPNPIDRIINQDTYDYNLTTYEWKKWDLSNWSTLFGLFGTNVTKSKNFDKKNRMFFKMYDVDYIFYKTAGMKVKRQYRGFLWRWYNTKAGVQEIAVGLEKLYGKIQHSLPIQHPQIYGFTTFVNGKKIDVKYAGFGEFDFLHKILSPIHSFHTETALTEDEAAYVMEEGVEMLKQYYGQHFTLRNPMILFYEVTAQSSNVCILGHIKTQEKKFHQKFSESYSFPIPMQGPLRFRIVSKSNVYGALKYNNAWRGIRFKTI